MDHDKLMNEMDRILDKLGKTEPGSKEYEVLIHRLNELQKIFLAEDKSCEDQMRNRHQRELDKRKLELDEKRCELESRKMDIQERELEAKREADEKRYELDCRRADIQERELEGRQKIDELKVGAGIDEAKERESSGKRQAVWRLVEIGAQGLITLAGIVLTGKLEETSILSTKAWSLIRKA